MVSVGNASDGDTITTIDNGNAFLLEAATNGYYIKDSNDKYYSNQSKYNSFTIQGSQPDGVWAIAYNGDGTYKLTYGTKFVQYSTQYKSFGVYSSKQSGAIYPSLYTAATKTTTAIQTIGTADSGHNTTATDNATYTLQGMRVNAQSGLKPGIYVRGGHKFVVR